MAASVEEKKLQYSQQLAAYTLRQWNAVRSSPQSSEKQSARDKSKSRRDAERENHDARSPERGERQSNGQTTPGERRDNSGRRAIQVVDFASRHSSKNATPTKEYQK